MGTTRVRRDGAGGLTPARPGALPLAARRRAAGCRIAAIVASLRGGWPGMQVRDGMSAMVLTVGPGHTLRQAAAAMSRRGVGAAVVRDPEAPPLGILTERAILHAVGAGKDPDTERVADHLTSDLVFAAP